MNILFLLSSFFFFVWITRNILFWTYLWQVKEYRLDRFLIHFTETTKGKEILSSPFSWFKWFVLVLYVIPVFYDATLYYYHVLLTGVFAIDGLLVFKEIITRRLRKPVFTFRALFIVLGAFLFLTLFYVFPILDAFVWLLLLSRAVPFIVSVFVFFLSIPSEMVKDYLIEKASKKIQSKKDLLVIGVSGSYGKSSTKEYISHILSTKKNVVKTEGSNNTPIGIAQTIRKKIQDDTDIFVVELGSYKKGEVLELCEIVRPTISITTSVSDQHLSLYGSFQNIIETEKELIDSLPKNGLALFNGNDKGALGLYRNTKKKKIIYKTGVEDSTDDAIVGQNLQVKKNGISFDVLLKNKRVHFESPLLGEHTVENILPGIYLGMHLGMTPHEIKEAVATLTPLPKTMIKRDLPSGVVVVDDTFNVSPESVEASLEYMKLYSQKKVLVLEPLIELGSNAEINHYKLGKKIAEVCDEVFLTNKNFYSSIMSGVKDADTKCRVRIANTKEIIDGINTLKKGDIVLLEGREPGLVLQKIL